MAHNGEPTEGVVDLIEKQILTCDVCFGRIRQPKLLQCHHAFCKSCLEMQLSINFKLYISCPTCRQQTPLPNAGVSALPTDFKISHLLEICAKRDQQQIQLQRCGPAKRTVISADRRAVPPACFVCFASYRRKIKASVYCVSCDKHMCRRCAERHDTVSVFSSHSLIQYTKPSRAITILNSSKCSQHRAESLRFHCRSCDRRVCVLCVLSDGHIQHSIDSVADSVLCKNTSSKNELSENVEILAESSRDISEDSSNETGRCRLITPSTHPLGSELHAYASELDDLCAILQHLHSTTDYSRASYKLHQLCAKSPQTTSFRMIPTVVTSLTSL